MPQSQTPEAAAEKDGQCDCQSQDVPELQEYHGKGSRKRKLILKVKPVQKTPVQREGWELKGAGSSSRKSKRGLTGM